jgi:hypothetical protein
MTKTPLAVVHEVVVNVGGLPLALRMTDQSFSELLKTRYANFLGNTPAEVTFDVDLVAPTLPVGECDTRADLRGDNWILERGDFRAEWNIAQRVGRIRQSANPYSIDSVLRIVYTLILAREGGFLVHSASTVRNGKAFLFSGVSGAGKTTMSRLAPPDAHLLTDEISFIRKVGKGYRAFGTPFAGDLGKPGENISAPVANFYLLDKAPSNSIGLVTPVEAMGSLMRNILFFTEDRESINLVFQAASAFVDTVPVRRLSFFPDQRVWDLIV